MLTKEFLSSAKRSQKIILLGASGSIGEATIAYLSQCERFELIGASIHTDLEKGKDLLKRKDLQYLTVTGLQRTSMHLPPWHQKTIFYGERGMFDMVEHGSVNEVDTVIIAISGAAAIRITLHCLRLGFKIGLANKEVLVTVGTVLQDLMQCIHRNPQNPLQKKGFILPIDSEHNSLFQLTENRKKDDIYKWILTASGGPFLNYSWQQVKKMKKKDVLTHPTWKMGDKITVDSAGMINKGLEVIEAVQLFSIRINDIAIYIHPQSYVHAMIQLKNGSYMLHASEPDMRFPIAHILNYPEYSPLSTCSPAEWPVIDFQIAVKDKFPGFALALECARLGGVVPAIFNAANESAVDEFLNDHIDFYQIPDIITEVLERFSKGDQSFPDSVTTKKIDLSMKLAERKLNMVDEMLEPYLDADRMARIYVKEVVAKRGVAR